jgi:quinol monooxygenase YgiN
MAIGVIWYPPVDQQTYDAVREKVLQAGVDKGMTFHAAGEAEGSWRIFERWDSREALASYMREDLHPAIDEVSGGQAPHPEPEHVFDIYYQRP